MARMRCKLPLLLLAMLIATARAEPVTPTSVRLSYAGVVDGLQAMAMTAEITLTTAGYHIILTGRTSGLIGLFYHAQWHTEADGAWAEAGVAPSHYDNTGIFGGNPRHVAIDFIHGEAVLRVLDPIDDGEHQPVPAPAMRDSIDALAVMALTIRQVALSDRCETEVVEFDGRKVQKLRLHPAGEEALPATTRSIWNGSAVRCDFHGQVIAGFDRSGTNAAVDDTMWLARVVPGAPKLPVRMIANTHHLGRVVLYLTSVEGQ